MAEIESTDEAELGSVLRDGKEALEDRLEDEMVGWRWKSLIWKGWKEVGTSRRVGSYDKLNLVQRSKLAGKHWKRGWKRKQGR